MGLFSLMALLVTLSWAASKCSDYTSDGCGKCTGERWLLGHCGFCWDDNTCADGHDTGPVDGSCRRWEWYGESGAPGAKCCGDSTSCFSCAEPQCAWCQEQPLCVHTKTASNLTCSPVTSCCSTIGDCAKCGATAGCSWCGAEAKARDTYSVASAAHLFQCMESTQCADPDPLCCSVLPDCSSCQAAPNGACAFCLYDRKCHAASALCPLPAEPK